jgi:hypothetical protein
MFSWFLVEYLYYEHVHTFTYDVFRERIGFTLTWGCFVFYPFFYCIGVRPLYIVAAAAAVAALLRSVPGALECVYRPIFRLSPPPPPNPHPTLHPPQS